MGVYGRVAWEWWRSYGKGREGKGEGRVALQCTSDRGCRELYAWDGPSAYFWVQARGPGPDAPWEGDVTSGEAGLSG